MTGWAPQTPVFEIYDKASNLVDTIRSDGRGLAVSRQLPLGRYTIREVKAPANYGVNETPLTADFKLDVGNALGFVGLVDLDQLQAACRDTFKGDGLGVIGVHLDGLALGVRIDHITRRLQSHQWPPRRNAAGGRGL